MKTSWRAVAVLLGLGWAATMVLPVAVFGPAEGETWSGWTVLLLGWIGLLVGQFAWLANFLFAAALILLFRSRPPLVWGLMIGLLTSLLAVQALTWTQIIETRGSMVEVMGYGPGYYLWIAVTFLGGAALCLASLAEARPAPSTAHA